MDAAIKKTRKQSSHSLLQNYQQFGCGTTFMSGKGVPGKTILKSSATSVTTLTHMDNRSFLTVLVRGMALLKTLQRPTL